MAHLGFPPEFPPSKLLPLIEEVAGLLKGRNETVSVAETVSYNRLSAFQFPLHFRLISLMRTMAAVERYLF